MLYQSTALAGDAVSEFNKASKIARQGDPKTAIDILLKLVSEQPDSNIADDALYKAAELAEKEIGDFDLSINIYQRLTKEYPTSRNSMRAERALERLKQERLSGDEALQVYSRIVRNYSKIGLEKTMAEMRQFIKKYPDFVYNDQVKLWIADELRSKRKYQEAYDYYQSILPQNAKSDLAFHILRGMGDMAVELRKFKLAREHFLALAQFEGRIGYAKNISSMLVNQADKFILLQWIFYACLAIVIVWTLFLIIGISWKNVKFTLIRSWRIEAALISIPFLGTIIYLWNRAFIYRKSFGLLLVFQLLLSFFHTSFIETNKLSRKKKIIVFIMAIITATATTYAVFYWTDLINLIIDTIRNDWLEKGKIR